MIYPEELTDKQKRDVNWVLYNSSYGNNTGYDAYIIEEHDSAWIFEGEMCKMNDLLKIFDELKKEQGFEEILFGYGVSNSFYVIGVKENLKSKLFEKI